MDFTDCPMTREELVRCAVILALQVFRAHSHQLVIAFVVQDPNCGQAEGVANGDGTGLGPRPSITSDEKTMSTPMTGAITRTIACL